MEIDLSNGWRVILIDGKYKNYITIFDDEEYEIEAYPYLYDDEYYIFLHKWCEDNNIELVIDENEDSEYYDNISLDYYEHIYVNFSKKIIIPQTNIKYGFKIFEDLTNKNEINFIGDVIKLNNGYKLILNKIYAIDEYDDPYYHNYSNKEMYDKYLRCKKIKNLKNMINFFINQDRKSVV